MLVESKASKLDLIKKRASSLQKARYFFTSKGYFEIDVPSIVKYPAVDAYIDSFEVKSNENIGYLHTSPEYLMKRILTIGMKKIFYLGHVFRVDEIGKLHNLEFTMAEWYHVGFSLNEIIEETLDFCKNFIGEKKVVYLSYRNAFLKFLKIDPFITSIAELKIFAFKSNINISSELDKDSWLQLLFSDLIEPKFKNDIFYVISEYPKTQAALSKTKLVDSFEVAERFEIYYNQIELANGYFELNDSDELHSRFKAENRKRELSFKKPYPIDKNFISSIDHLPNCSGVSVGFDRLLMLAYKKSDIKDVILFPFNEL